MREPNCVTHPLRLKLSKQKKAGGAYGKDPPVLKLYNGHFFTRASYSTRWDTTVDGNCHTQCHGCNILHEHKPDVYYTWYIDTFGLDSYYSLQKRHWEITHFKDADLKELLLEKQDEFVKLIQKRR